MSFLSWHYTHGLSYYIQRYVFALESVSHYFSLTLLPVTLFSPWKRMVDTSKKPGFNLGRWFEKFTFNIFSRIIGSVVRTILFFTGIFCLLLLSVLGIFGFIFWLCIPLLSFSVYQKYRRHPKIVVDGLVSQMEHIHPVKALLSTEAGHFIFNHLTADSSSLVSNAQTVNIPWGKQSLSTMKQLMSVLLNAGLWSDDQLRTLEIKQEDILAAAGWWDTLAAKSSYISDNPTLGRPGIGLELLYGYTPNLDKFVSDLGDPQSFSHHLIGRENVVNRIERNLANGQNVILTGQPGVGKHTVILEFAHRAARGELGKKLAYQRVLELDYSALMAGSEDTAGKKALLSQILAEAAYAGNVILVVRDIHRLTNAEIEGIDVTDVLETYIQKGGLRIISTVSNIDYERFVSRNVRLKKYFEVITVQQPTAQEALEILMDAATYWEQKAHLTITVQALRLVLSGSDKYITEAPYPEKALEILDAVVAYVQSKSDPVVTVGDVKTILAEKTGISFTSMTDDRKLQLSNLENIIHERLINQETAVRLIAKTLRSKTVGVVDNKRPLGAFLFLGPTGVGKTETAKVLAKVYFGSEQRMIRFNMAEYAGREGLERLIGSVERNLPGALTTGIQKNPSSLLLLDEIEKAPPGIHNLLLALIDEGEITDAFDRVIKAQNLFIIATSNAGAEEIRQLVQQGVNSDDLQKSALEHVMQQQIFSPELINRFDGVVVYEPLSKEHLYHVAEILTKELAANLREKNIQVTFSPEAIEKIANEGYDPAFGARPMRRLIELEIGDMLGRAILVNDIVPGAKITIIPGEGEKEYSFESNS